MAKCEYEGCNNQVLADGLCSLHLPLEKREAANFSEELFEKDFIAMLYSQFNLEVVLNSISKTEFSGLIYFNADAENFHHFLKGELDDSLSRKYETQAAHCDEIKLSGVVFSDLSEELSSHIGFFLNIGLKLSRKFFFERCRFSCNIYQVEGKSSYSECFFRSPFISISDNRSRFDDCLFEGRIDLDLMVSSKRRGVYLSGFDYDCSFDGDVFIGSEDPPEEELVISGLLPHKSLSGSLSIKGATINLLEIEDVFSVFKPEGRKHVYIRNCKIEGYFCARNKDHNFYLREDQLPCLYLEDSFFEDVFDLSCFHSGMLSFRNSSFKKDVILSGVKTRNFTFFNVDFEDFVSLEETEVLDGVAVFKYVTCHTYATFRNAKFLGGLDLDRANFSGEANFLGVDADGGNIKKTTRETYRLIKHSFDKTGNHLEANKFFAKEMDKYREEVSGNKTLPLWDRAIYHINKGVSDFGQNYLLSIGWLLLAMVFYFYAFVLHRHMGWLHTESSCDVFASGYDKLNCLASGMIPFKGFLTNGMELLSLVFYIIFAVLVWQTVVALKRHTRR